VKSYALFLIEMRNNCRPVINVCVCVCGRMSSLRDRPSELFKIGKNDKENRYDETRMFSRWVGETNWPRPKEKLGGR